MWKRVLLPLVLFMYFHTAVPLVPLSLKRLISVVNSISNTMGAFNNFQYFEQ